MFHLYPLFLSASTSGSTTGEAVSSESSLQNKPSAKADAPGPSGSKPVVPGNEQREETKSHATLPTEQATLSSSADMSEIRQRRVQKFAGKAERSGSDEDESQSLNNTGGRNGPEAS